MSKVAKFYVYEHIRPDTGEVFYVGKGNGNRAWRIKERSNPRHKNIQKKLKNLGLEVQDGNLSSHLNGRKPKFRGHTFSYFESSK